jgi:F-type H+-transporting ATPase subunit gamma
MTSTRELKLRHKSVGNIKQITRAMEMVATTKLRRFQDRAVASRPYAQEIAGLVRRLAAVLGDEVADRPLFVEGAGERTAVLLVSSDRGLCGAYNSNLFRFHEAWLRENEIDPASVDYYVVGRKAYQYISKMGRNIAHYLVEPPLEKMDFRGASVIARILTTEFLEGGHRATHIHFTAFESMVKYVPTTTQLLPIASEELGADGGADMLFEPDPETIFEAVVPRYVDTTVFNALLEALTSEFASRRFSMKNATEAADEMQGILIGIYNRKRQESITKELLDIVGGVEALK